MEQFSPETATLSSAPPGPWLSLVGLGEDGRSGLCAEALAALESAEIVFGGERHLRLIGDVPGEARPWPQPFRNALPAILAEKGRNVCVLATSDPFHYGIGAGLTKAVPAAEMRVIPQLSSFSMACTRMRWPQEECGLVSLHGRALQRIIPFLQPGARVLALSWDDSTPLSVAQLMSARAFGESTITVLETIGGPNERVRQARADSFALDGIVPLNLLAIEVVASRDARMLPLATGLSDDWFEHDGQLTKADIRAITLSALAPRAGELLWDIGAGSGSIGIEWSLRHRHNRAIAFEERPERAARIARNRLALGAPPLEVVEGKAPESFAGKTSPDAVFIGGGLTDPGVFEAAFAALKPRGRLVANAVTIEGEARLAGLFAAHGGNLRRIGVAHLDPIGTMHGWRAAMAVTQWRGGEAVSGITAGIGLRPGTSEADIEACLTQTLAAAGLHAREIGSLATLASRRDEPGLAAVAQARDLTLVAIPDKALAGFEAACATRSTRISGLYGVGSVAEAAALAAAGPGATLIQPRIATARVTCALARGAA